MPTAKKAKVPKYCLLKPRGLAYVRIRGRVRYLGKYESPESREAYGRLVAELATQPDLSPAASIPGNVAGLTVVELADAYWAFCKGYYRKKDGTPSGWLDHIHLVLHTHLAGLYGRTPAADFGPKAFKADVTQVYAERDQALAVKSANINHSRVAADPRTGHRRVVVITCTTAVGWPPGEKAGEIRRGIHGTFPRTAWTR